MLMCMLMCVCARACVSVCLHSSGLACVHVLVNMYEHEREHEHEREQECANAIEHGTTLTELAMTVHTHPTLCEVLDEAFKAGLGRAAH